MGDYEVTVSTGYLAFAGTFDKVYIKLVGTKGESGPHRLKKLGPYFYIGNESTFTVSCSEDIGPLLLIQLFKELRFWFMKDSWFPAKIVVKSPIGDVFNFPIYHWITDQKTHSFREGKALLEGDETNLLAKYVRQQEIQTRKEVYGWNEFAEGIPHCIKEGKLPADEDFSCTKSLEFIYTLANGVAKLKLAEFVECKKEWTSIADIERVYNHHQTKIADYVHDHWKDDDFFGFQFLNGINPTLIRLCDELPPNFPVTHEMVFKDGLCSLEDEMEKGNIFLCDYKILDGVKANIIKGQQQYLMAPLVLLHKTSDNKLKPIAIQLKQKATEDNPIFTPHDSEYDWLLAKIFVRSADFNLHELNTHLLRTHLLAEVFSVSLLRNLPMVHPLYKLLIPHTRYTLQINVLARDRLISKDGIFSLHAASGGEGLTTILQKSLASLTYKSLCIHDDIEDRGLKDVPNFYYREDGLKLWDIIYSFVKGVLEYYYKDDADVEKDPELKNWIQDIYEKGFLSNKATGIPTEFQSVEALVKFVTMVIFTCSAQHSAVNTGQYDFGGWMPNSPSTLKRPPPTTKGKTTEATILNTLPDMDTTAYIMATLWLLSTPSTDTRFLGKFPEDHFTETEPCEKIKKFREELATLSKEIKARNEKMKVPYTYLDPEVVENSVSI
ncbi:arachidonate 12-lipoxygenase, 12R-type-like [Melanotaenia boesemani]|uniref:arachidonate 12-lipoxygenase, 12R-type-like n=1 Tax=Melanotaenia boesemani TaxID=1250792 RepID=UPI001C047743|nr:arachidonate 12-lipoxygenase, 12R-type-like [Melanotaenia boesemani]